MDEKVIIVEGGSDKKRLARILAEPVEIICTNGTISPYHLEELLAPYEEHELFVFVDADEDGEKIRILFKREFPDSNSFVYGKGVQGSGNDTLQSVSNHSTWCGF